MHLVPIGKIHRLPLHFHSNLFFLKTLHLYPDSIFLILLFSLKIFMMNTNGNPWKTKSPADSLTFAMQGLNIDSSYNSIPEKQQMLDTNTNIQSKNNPSLMSYPFQLYCPPPLPVFQQPA
jgi:hypothetical protein